MIVTPVALLANNVSFYPRAGVALLIVLAVLLAIAVVVANQRGAAAAGTGQEIDVPPRAEMAALPAAKAEAQSDAPALPVPAGATSSEANTPDDDMTAGERALHDI